MFITGTSLAIAILWVSSNALVQVCSQCVGRDHSTPKNKRVLGAGTGQSPSWEERSIALALLAAIRLAPTSPDGSIKLQHVVNTCWLIRISLFHNAAKLCLDLISASACFLSPHSPKCRCGLSNTEKIAGFFRDSRAGIIGRNISVLFPFLRAPQSSFTSLPFPC